MRAVTALAADQVDGSFPLANEFHEAFCQFVSGSSTAQAAYQLAQQQAGRKRSGNSSAKSGAYKLMQREDVAARVNHLRTARAQEEAADAATHSLDVERDLPKLMAELSDTLKKLHATAAASGASQKELSKIRTTLSGHAGRVIRSEELSKDREPALAGVELREALERLTQLDPPPPYLCGCENDHK